MTTEYLRSALFGFLCLGVLLALGTIPAQSQNQLDLSQIPKKVMNSLKAKFPQAEIHKWTKEDEGGVVVYDFEFKQQGHKFEADIKEDGTIHNWEKAVTFESLPSAVQKAVKERYPNATFKEIMAITAVKNGHDELEGFEIVMETAQKQAIEVTFAPDGRILEDSVDQQ